jgi:hypothetical protein
MSLKYTFYLYFHVLHSIVYMRLNLEFHVMKVMGKWSNNSYASRVCMRMCFSCDVFREDI